MNAISAYWGGNTDFLGGSPAAILEATATQAAAALWVLPPDLHYWAPIDAKRDAYFVSLVVRGSHQIRYHRNGRGVGWIRKPGQMVLALPRSSHRDEVETNNGFSVLHLHLPQALMSGIIDAESLASRPGTVEFHDLRCLHDPQIERIARDVFDDMLSQTLFSRLHMDALSLDLAISLLRAHSNLVETRRMVQNPTGGLAKWQLTLTCERMMASVELGLPEPSLVELASAVGLSQNQFARSFTQSTGETPHHWLTGRRIARAQRLMNLSPRRGLTDIALDVGYANQSTLGRAFRRVVGVSPTDWRRER